MKSQDLTANRDFYSDVLNDIMDGLRLRRPARCPLPFYDLMTDCWSYVPHLPNPSANRPLFDQVVPRLKTILAHIREDGTPF